MPDRAVAAALSSGTRTVTGNGSAVRVPLASQNLAVVVNVTSASGTTPSLTPSVEWAHDGVTFAAADPPDVFTALTTTGARVKTFAVRGEFFRIAYTITGTTPSFTFAATAYGV